MNVQEILKKASIALFLLFLPCKQHRDVPATSPADSVSIPSSTVLIPSVGSSTITQGNIPIGMVTSSNVVVFPRKISHTVEVVEDRDKKIMITAVSTKTVTETPDGPITTFIASKPVILKTEPKNALYVKLDPFVAIGTDGAVGGFVWLRFGKFHEEGAIFLSPFVGVNFDKNAIVGIDAVGYKRDHFYIGTGVSVDLMTRNVMPAIRFGLIW